MKYFFLFYSRFSAYKKENFLKKSSGEKICKQYEIFADL
jgi:hypothetical protein